MKRYAIILLALCLAWPTATNAQRRKKTTKKVAKPVVVEDPRIQQMLASTQKVVFIDSIVASKKDFLRRIPLSKDAGYLEQNDTLGQFTNELKDHRLTTYFDTKDSTCHISQSDYIGNRWTEAQPLEGISNASANFPFLMSDGITLYFAQQGPNSIGGYDIFVTRYDSDTGTYLKAENLGMPFSSTANDYLYAIDEANNLGYFVTDRRQPAGKGCIYVFIPNETRKVYPSETYSDDQLRSLAAIERIADSWDNKAQRNEALNRLYAARQQQSKATQANTKLTPLESLRHQAETLEKALDLARRYYARATSAERQNLRHEILTSEKELEALQLEIRQEEKKQNAIKYKDNN